MYALIIVFIATSGITTERIDGYKTPQQCIDGAMNIDKRMTNKAKEKNKDLYVSIECIALPAK